MERRYETGEEEIARPENAEKSQRISLADLQADPDLNEWFAGKKPEPVVGPEQQEIHKSPETSPEKEPGSGIRPSQDAPPEPNDTAAGKMEITPEISGEMDRLWQQSVKDDGSVQEHAATLVRDPAGNVKLVNPVAGDANSVEPNRNVPEEDELLGTFHTHPYSREEGGHTGVPFSGQDIVLTINEGDEIALVQSGEDVFAIQRTDATPDTVDKDTLKQEFGDALFNYLDDPNVSFAEANYKANLEICQKYSLAFYAGRNGSLKEVYRP